jgi:hypothetical protein
MTKPIRLYSKSSVGQDWACPRKFFWNYCANGTGVVKNNMTLELFMGNAIHDALSTIAYAHPNVDIDLIAKTTFDQMHDTLLPLVADEKGGANYAKEQATLVEGLIRGYFRHVWPKLIGRYPIIKLVETPMLYLHDNVGMMAKPDLVLGDESGDLVYIEFKSTSTKKDTWVSSWDTAIQVHSTVKAIEAHLGEPVGSVIVLGLYKGYESWGKQSSPMCYAYRKSGNPPFTQDQISYEYKPGLKKSPVWEMDGGVKKWVEEMPEQILADQFPMTPPIFVNEDLIAAFLRQRAMREKQIHQAILDLEADPAATDVIMDEVFPQRWDECYPAWGRPCTYARLCHGPQDVDPIEAGYQARSTEHQQPFIDLLETK